MNRTLVAIGLGSLLILGGCSGSNEDVRITFCKALTQQLLGQKAGIEWGNVSPQHGRFTDLHLTLNYSIEGQGGQSSCIFELEDEQDSSLADFDPLAPYATLPHQAKLNGTAVGQQRLANAIQDTLTTQAKDLLDEIKQRGNRAASQLSDTLKATLTQ